MAVTEIPARDFTFELNNGTSAVPDWLAVEALNSWSHSPQATDANTTKFSDAGRSSHMKITRGDEFTLTGLYHEDESTGARAPGQEACEAWAAEVGTASRKNFRITSPGGTVQSFDCTATVTSGGGGDDDVNAWELAIVVSGAITTA